MIDQPQEHNQEEQEQEQVEEQNQFTNQMRPPSARSETEKPQTYSYKKRLIHIETCRDCKSHRSTTWHDESKYDANYNLVKAAIEELVPGVEVLRNIDENRVFGGFEIMHESKVLFSKKTSKLWPHPKAVAQRVQLYFEDLETGKDVSAYGTGKEKASPPVKKKREERTFTSGITELHMFNKKYSASVDDLRAAKKQEEQGDTRRENFETQENQEQENQEDQQEQQQNNLENQQENQEQENQEHAHAHKGEGEHHQGENEHHHNEHKGGEEEHGHHKHEEHGEHHAKGGDLVVEKKESEEPIKGGNKESIPKSEDGENNEYGEENFEKDDENKNGQGQSEPANAKEGNKSAQVDEAKEINEEVGNVPAPQGGDSSPSAEQKESKNEGGAPQNNVPDFMLTALQGKAESITKV